mmetsp:Transcript_27316/g.45554  ORF Transcript_27316/g.45554 Transcript_27316/m.45554 type:complete len:142 (-) Transcript_27316:255-680(-)|eukprot:CAMPEP_0119324902 /NCGR_PEP_ID=MMETSP1333-20130426/64484_1 /TAXON_ID=418940 /ORGANISM="Scyphosphaera apsteinii, Strain RCC1455" /LENGTH=141 /DNA_ID=CAMNT_0007332729 /DNA_START=415 /DNA_END=840 /DNA_ORIENTATION=-
MADAGVAGPLFISVGKPEQLTKFLQLNPELSGAKALIDNSMDFAGYKAAGFNFLMGDKTLDSPPDFKPPKQMGPQRWWTYLRNVMDLSPVPEQLKFGDVPQGVRVLGGTYALDGNEVKFSWMDDVPGATPEIEDVMSALRA